MTVTGKAKLSGVIGWPVSHSLSPILHGTWIARCGLDAAYIPLAVRPENLAGVLDCLPHMGFAGANLTLPHKETAFRHLRHCDEAARMVGAVNTLVIASDGKIEGRNTDAFGYAEAMRSSGYPLSRFKRICVLGAGGAARAVLYALAKQSSADIVLLNRTRARAEALTAEFSTRMGARITTLDWGDWTSAGAGCELLINTTSLGLEGQPTIDIDLKAFPPGMVVSDIVYRPLMTSLLVEARARGHPIVTGLGMLIHQARAGFGAWFGCDPPVELEIETVLLKAMGQTP